MKKILLALTVLVAVYSCTSKKEKSSKEPGKETTQTSLGVTSNQYIVFMKSSFAEPLIKSLDTTTFSGDTAAMDAKRVKLTDTVEKYFEGVLGKTVDKQKIFVDVSIGAIINIPHDSLQALLNDTANIEGMIKDTVIDISKTITINPIQQTDPTYSDDPLKQWLSEVLRTINPIQQLPSERQKYDIDPTTFITRAISVAGGPVTVAATNRRKIWFLDTGIDTDNPNLTVDVAHGARIIGGAIGGSMDDDNGHGTFCAGIAAGKPVGDPDLPAAPKIHYGLSEGATVVPIKVLNQDGEGLMSDVILGLNWVAQAGYAQPGDVVNLSMGAYDAGNTYIDRGNPNKDCYVVGLNSIIRNLAGRNIFVTMAAGNEAGNAKAILPGCINGAHKIFTVSSVDSNLSCASYANFNIGPPPTQPVDCVTVGTRVFSLWKDGQFRMASGTSASCALVAGIINVRNSDPILVTNNACRPATGPAYKLAKH